MFQNDVNVVIVDWGTGGNTWNYYKAAVNTKVVGYQIARSTFYRFTSVARPYKYFTEFILL